MQFHKINALAFLLRYDKMISGVLIHKMLLIESLMWRSKGVILLLNGESGTTEN